MLKKKRLRDFNYKFSVNYIKMGKGRHTRPTFVGEMSTLSHKTTIISTGPSLYYVSKMTGLVGSEKWQFLLKFSTIYADVGWVGGSEIVQKYADVI